MSRVEFGVFDWIDLPKGGTPSDAYELRMAMLRRADAGAFTRYHLAEHHATPLGLAPSPAVFLAAAARETSRIRLAATTFVIPLYQPLRLVQEWGMLDQLSGGRLEIGIGRGSSPIEAAMYGLTAEEAQERFHRISPAMLEALETGVYRDPERADAPPVELFVRPVQSSIAHWYPTANAASVLRVAEQGHHVLYGFGFASPALEDIAPVSAEFARISAEHGHAAARFGMLRHVFIGETDAEAREIALAAFTDHYDAFSHLWRKTNSERFTEQPDLDELIAQHRFMVGSVETVAEQVAHAVRVSGVSYFAAAFAWGTLSAPQVLRSVDLFDTRVIPEVEAALASAAV